MRKNPLFIVALLFAFSNFYAQEITIGIKGGINYNSIGELYHYGNNSGLGTGVTPNDDTVFSGEKDIGIQFGVFGMIAFDKFFIRPEVNYVSSKNHYLLNKTANWTSTKIDVPVLFGYKIFEPVSLYVGPSFSSISDMKLEGVEPNPNTYPYIYKKSSTSINAGILVEYGRFGIDLRYQYGITKVEELRVNIDRGVYGTNIADVLEYNPSQIQISIHINLLKINAEGGNKLRTGWRGKGCPN